MKLLVGLGNPGAKYARNRHNVGFMAVERIAAAHGLGPWRRKFQGEIAEGTIAGERVMLLKPQTYMNESGRAVGEAARFLKVATGDMIVLYDEIDLAPGKLKAKLGGGNAGHNGLRSISAHLDNDYVRIRIGVGHPGHKDLVANYVLSDFAKADQAWLEPLLEAMAGAAGRLVAGDHERFLTDVALALRPDDDGGPRAQRKGRAAKEDAGEASQVHGSSEPSRRPVASGTHPAGERASKRQSALAENLRKWLEGRKRE
jgi:PTH1 family peptidyl-tRNA hydrolase